MLKNKSGEWLTQPNQIASNAKDHIQRILQTQPPDNLSQETNMDITPMSYEAQHFLTLPFSKD